MLFFKPHGATEWVELTESWRCRWCQQSRQLARKWNWDIFPRLRELFCRSFCRLNVAHPHPSVSRGLYHMSKKHLDIWPGSDSWRRNPLKAITRVWLSTVWNISIYHWDVCGGPWVLIADELFVAQAGRRAKQPVNRWTSSLPVSVAILWGWKQNNSPDFLRIFLEMTAIGLLSIQVWETLVKIKL